jgi:hypothetical protein
MTTQYTSLLLDLEQLDNTMRERNPQASVTIYDTQTSSHLSGGPRVDGTDNDMAPNAAAA